MSCEKSCARIVVLLANTMFLAMGVIIVAFGVKVSNTMSQEFNELQGQPYIVTTISLGGVMLALSVVGFCGVIANHQPLLFTYSLGIFMITIALFTLGGAVLSYSQDIDNSKDGNPETSRQALFLDFVYASFDECCNNGNVPECTVISDSFCTNDPDRVDTFAVAMSEGDFCAVLTDIRVDGHRLASTNAVDVVDGACGSGTVALYVRDFVEVVDSNLVRLAIGNFVAGSISALLLITACYLTLDEEVGEKPDPAYDVSRPVPSSHLAH